MMMPENEETLVAVRSLMRKGEMGLSWFVHSSSTEDRASGGSVRVVVSSRGSVH